MQDQKTTPLNLNTLMTRLKSEVSLTAPAWAFMLAGLVVLVMLGAALD
ncbi:hypothetical protein [Roseobacter weihaiensis]|nr:hypothetical protein [Roseobacter sp. H9]